MCTLCSSGILWEKKKGKRRYKPLKSKYSMMLEQGYQLYLNELAIDDGKSATPRKTIDKVEVCAGLLLKCCTLIHGYVVPVLWMRLCLHTMGPMCQNQAWHCLEDIRQVAVLSGHQCLVEFIRMRHWGQIVLFMIDLLVISEWSFGQICPNNTSHLTRWEHLCL